MECLLSQFDAGTKLGAVADIPSGCAAVQQDLGRLELGGDKPNEVQQGQV